MKLTQHLEDGEKGIPYHQYLNMAISKLSARHNKTKVPLVFINTQEAVQRKKYILETFSHSFERIVRVVGVNSSSYEVRQLKLSAPKAKEKILAVLLSHGQCQPTAPPSARSRQMSPRI